MYPKIYIDLFREFQRKPEVFVAMPFSREFEPRWKYIIKPAISSCNLKPHRVKERYISDSIPVDILKGLCAAKLLLFDISNEQTGQPNPNVMYELGVAHAIRLPEEVIIIRDEQSQDSPFDIKHIRWNTLYPNRIKGSINKLKKLIKNAETEICLTKDSMIERILNSLDPEMVEFLEIIRDYYEDIGQKYMRKGFDLYPFDPDRKGLYGLMTKDCSEQYLREIARYLVNFGILKSAKPLPLHKKVYGGTPEYHLTEIGKIILTKLPRTLKNSKIV